MSEHDEQVKVFDVLRLNESQDERLKWIYAIPNGGHRHPAVAGKLKAEGVKRGISDICLPFPVYPGIDDDGPVYHGAYIEMKDGNKKPTPEQAEFLLFCEENGYQNTVAHSADEALNFIEDYCEIRLRGRK